MTDLQRRIAALSPEQRELLERRLADRAAARGTESDDRIRPRDRSRATPLAFQQEREWAIAKFRPANNIPGAFRVEGNLDLSLLSEVLSEIAGRHEVLRSTIELQPDGARVQVVHAVAPVPTPMVDLMHLAPEQQREEFLRHWNAEVVRPFAPSEPIRLRTFILRMGEDNHVVLIITDHAAADLVSVAILVQEFAALYLTKHNGGGPALPPLEIQYGDFAAWQREVGEKRMAAEVEHWRQTLDGIPGALTLPSDRPFPARPTYSGAAHIVDLPPDLADDLRRFCEREKASLGVVLLAACSVLLYRYLGQEDLVIGELVSGRGRAEVERLIGCFVTALPLRMRLADGQSLRAVVRQAHDTVLTAYDHQDLPMDRLLEQLDLGHEASRTSMSHMWIDVRTPERTLEVPGLRITEEPIEVNVAAAPLTLDANPSAGTLQLQWVYMTEMFDEDTVVVFAEQFDRVLRQLVSAPETTVGQVDLAVGPAPATRVATTGSRSAEPGFVELFQRRVALAPHSPAVVCDGVATSYATLNREANRLARDLRARGVGRDTRVGILVDRSPQLAVAILGVLKAGGAYVPLDPTYPPDRMAFMLTDADARVLVTQERLAARLAGTGPVPSDGTVLLDGASGAAGDATDEADLDLPDPPDPASLAYVVYTSGSTGRPKGAMIEHHSLATFARDVVDRLGLGAGDRFLQFASPGFDVLAEELFPTWLAGGAVVIPTQHLISGEDDLADLIDRERLTVIELPTAYWHEWTRELDRQNRKLAPSLRLVIIGGERVLPERLAMWRRLAVPLAHVYGLTETTVSSTFFRLDPDDPVHHWPNFPIGTPLPSAELRILDRRLRPVPTGASGELYIAGPSLARGYLSRPGLSAQRFVADPDPTRPGQRLYRTGDLVRQRPDGNLEFISRVDTQIKIRGFRVEPAEIESVLSRHPQVAESTVTLYEPTPGDRRLVAYLVPHGSAAPPNLGELRQFLEQDLPSYMVPSAFVTLDALPLNANGKVDRDRLPAPDGVRPELAEDYVPPRTPLQRQLAEIVAAVVGVEQVGIHDNFFDLGGDSIQAIQVVARAQDQGIGLSPLDFFEHPTIALLAQAAHRADPGNTIRPRPADAEPVLSFDQERLWLEHQLRPRTAYHVGGRRRMIGPLALDVLEKSIRAILERHEILRTRFPVVDGRPVTVVDDVADWRLEILDLSGRENGAEIAQQLMDEQTSTAFDLAEGPLFRCLLVKLSDTEHLLNIMTHHIVSDNWSIGLFAGELSALYAAGGDPARAGLPELPVQYRDFAVWQRRHHSGETLARKVDYWRHHLAGAPPALTMPDTQRSPGAGGGRTRSTLTESETAALHELCRRHGVTPFMVVLACLATVLRRWSGQPDLVIGTSVSGRTDVALENLIGVFINTMPLRVDLSGEPTFTELLRRVRRVALDGHAHSDAPFDVLVKELQVPRDPRRTPLFQVVLNVFELPPVDQFGDVSLELMDLPKLLSSFDLVFTAQEFKGALGLRLEFDAERYPDAMMDALLEHLRAMLCAVGVDTTKGILEYPLEPAGVDAGRTTSPGPTPHSSVERHASSRPDRIAMIDRDGEWSYARLSRAVDRAAEIVAERNTPGAGPLRLVRRPTATFVATALGCARAGVEFTVVEPPARPSDDAGTVADPDPTDPVPDGVVDLRDLHTDPADRDDPSPVRRGAAPSPDDAAGWAVERLGLHAGDRLAVLSGTAGQLLSTADSAFHAGATLVVPERPLAGDVDALVGWLAANSITVVCLTQPVLRAMAARGPRPELSCLRYALVENTGELISRDIEALRRMSPTCRFVGVYRGGRDGRPLAAYVAPDDWRIDAAPARVPLGTEPDGAAARLRLPTGLPAAVGEVAEIWLGEHRTGDLARRWSDGTLEYVGKLRQDYGSKVTTGGAPR
ncbi:non-ribosomal peptide synthetase [Micromonospora sediminicola]|uniref:non-ribosomal peptide synthetase n=1 Tax=Micromonospora sediminicola TaxID=946078 RepID=UPI000A53E46F|nr:non-ribosomal peptide synthetase [Micromonospora sediminicola]